jgi:hypothetical protein
MSRLLICLALCLLFALVYRQVRPTAEEPQAQPLAVQPLRPQWLALLAGGPTAGFPGGVPWAGLAQAGQANAGADALPDPDPVAFLEKCLARYERSIDHYTVTLQKQEWPAGLRKPKAREVVRVFFRERPFSVFMKWKELGGSKAKNALYVEGRNENQLLVMPAGLLQYLGVQELELDAPEVKESGRYTISEFGFKKATQRVLDGWYKARARNALHVTYEGVYQFAEIGNRPCYKLHRTDFDRPEEDGVTDLVLYIDVDTWLQVGTVLHGAGGRLIGEYYFRDLDLNTAIPPSQFEREALKR